MSDAERWNVGRLLQWTTDYLKKSGSTSPRLDAEVLLAEARGCQRIQLYTAFDEDPGEEVRSRFRELVKRRAGGEPVAYLVGHREFYSLTFRVTPAVLIPRPETEFVVLGVLDALQPRRERALPAAVVDIGTGSGAIAISVAKHAPECHVTACDISPEAVEVARQNAQRLEVADRIDFFVSDLFQAIPAQRKFDVVASNPPYISEGEMANLARDVREFEPRGALLAGPDGSDVIARLIRESAERIAPGGALIMEISPMLEGKVRSLLAADSWWSAASVTRDLAGLPRVIKAGFTP